MTKEVYMNRLNKLLDEAASDKELATSEYADLCRMAETEAADRAGMAETDLKNQQSDNVDEF